MSQILAVIVFGLLPGALMAFLGAGHLWNYLRLKRSDPVDIRQLNAPAGAVELVGTARAYEDTSRSPFTGTESLLHEWKVEKEGAGRRSGQMLLGSGQTTHPFLLQDGTGTVLVHPAGASRYLQTSTTIEVGADESPPPAIREFLETTDEIDREHDRTRWYYERRLDPGGDAYVFGPIREAAPSFDFPEPIDAVVGVENPGERRLTIGEDEITLSKILERARSNTEQFIITNADESGAEGQMLKIGALWLVLGVLFLVGSIALVVW